MPVTIPATQTTGTVITDALWNELVGAIAHLLGMKHANDTLANAAGSRAIGRLVGEIIPYAGSSAPAGGAWLLCDGKTIGSAGSGATARANADTETLYTHLWNGFTNAVLPIQDSAGTPTTRGSSAAADFAANKRLPLPDLRGRVWAGLDNLGGSSANRITAGQADTLGDASGAETHTLTTGEMPAHSHNVTVYAATDSSTNVRGGNAGGTGSIATTSTGGGAAHNNVQPSFFGGWLIYTGN